MRVLSWNMAAGFGYDARKHDRAWRWLAYADPDVALVQETIAPYRRHVGDPAVK